MSRDVIGREEELRAVAAFLGDAETLPAALVLQGGAGIGKTTLWRAAVGLARERSFRVLACSPAERETGLSFAALGDLLAGVVDEVLPVLPAPQRRALAAALLLEGAPGTAPEPRAIAAAVLTALQALAVRRPLLLAVDDLQWLDAPSAGALAFAVRRLAGEPVGLLLVQRGNGAVAAPLELDRVFAADRLRSLSVGPLSLGAVHRLLHERLGVAFPRPVLVRLYEASRGNPFFALELGRELTLRGARPSGHEPLPVPGTLRELVSVRIVRLRPAVREALAVAAAVAEPTVDRLGAVVGSQAPELLREAADGGVVELDSGRVRFIHPLFASVAYFDAGSGDRRSIHRRLAAVATEPEERARHLALAAEGADESVAASLEEAARRSAARGAPQVAAELCDRARASTPTALAEAIARRTIATGEYHLRAGDTERARAALERGLADAPAGDLTARGLLALAQARLREEGWHRPQQPLEQALEQADDVELRCLIEIDLAQVLMQRDELRAAAPHAEAAVALAQELDDPTLNATAVSYQAMLETLLGRRIGADRIERALALAREGDWRAPAGLRSDLPASAVLAAVRKWTDDFAGARSLFQAALEQAAAQHAEGALPPLLFQLGELECWAGNWEPAARCAHDCRIAAQQLTSPSLEALGLHLQAAIDAHRGRLETARATATQGLALSETAGNRRQLIRCLGLLGFIELSGGDAAQAHRQLGRAAELATAGGYRNPAVFRFLHDQVEALVALGELAAAEALVEHLTERGRALDSPWCLTTAARGRALVAAGRGDLDAALAALQRALAEHSRLPQPFEHARTLLVLGTVQRRAKRWRPARETLDRAARAFEELGAAVWAQAARAELDRIGGRRPTDGRLTPTELRVAELVAEGHSNKEIATLLFVTPKTVGTQLSRIYAKLGVHSRTQLTRHLEATRSAQKE